MSTILLFHLDELDGILPSDATGNLDDLNADADTTMPASASTWTGRGRAFVQASATGLIATDLTDRGSVLLRDVTVQAIVSLTLAGAAGAQTLICRGIADGSAAEMLCWGLELEEQAAHPGFVEVRWFWQDQAGAVHTQPPGVFRHPGDGNLFLLTATRRWEATDRVVVRYYVNDEQIAELVTADGDIGGGTTGHVMVGGRKTNATWDRFLNGTIDELRVLDEEVSHDEIREDWRRMTVHQPAGVAMFTGLTPPGSWWALNPGNDVGRLVKLTGELLGLKIAGIEQMRAMHLPDRADVDKIAEWERVCGITPSPSDSLDVRRGRVVGYLSRDEGFAVPVLQQLFAPLLDLDPTDVQILEFTNAIEDGFGTAINPLRWIVGSVGTWAVAAGELGVAQVAGADLRWEPTRATAYVRTSLAAIGGQFVVTGKLSTFTLPVNTLAGLWIYDRVTNGALWLGIKNVGGVLKLGYQVFAANALGAFTALVTPAPNQAHWLRVTRAKGAAEGTFDLWWSTTGPNAGFAKQNVVTTLTGIAWAGFAATCTDAALATDLAATFDDFQALAYNGLRTFCWYVYRDLALPGKPDLQGAQLLVGKVKPAHTHAAVITSKKVLCDGSAAGLPNRGPTGAL